MREDIERIVEAHWQGQLAALVSALGDVHHQVGTLLEAERDQRSRDAGEGRLGRSVGGFGSEALDLEALSGLLQQSGEAHEQGQRRHHRLERLATDLAAVQVRLERDPPRPSIRELTAGPDELLQAVEVHVAPVCEALSLVRQARLEVRARYDPREHDPLFAQFNWRQLDSAELALCPPFVVITEPRPHAGARLAAILELVTSGRPLTVVLLHRAWHPEHVEAGRAAALRGLNDVTLLFLAVRNVFFVQTSAASPTPMAERIVQGLESPRPTVLSVFAHGRDSEEQGRRAASALTSRGFPHLVYDPERAPDFVSCLDLSDNPDPEAPWVRKPLAFVDEGGARGELERPFTFADYACAEPELREQFAPLRRDQEESALPLATYLDCEPSQRRNRVPFVYAVDEKQRLMRLVPTQAMLAHSSDRLHLWTTLQELGGIDNPFVLAAQRRLREQFTAEMETALKQQKVQLDAESRVRMQAQLVQAVHTLVSRLTGITAPGTVAAPDAPSEPTAEPAADADHETR